MNQDTKLSSSVTQTIARAAKWSLLSEISAKLIVPLTNMILARILAPEVFGIIATITMVVSFTDMFTTAGFQKYLVQHEYKSKEELYKGTSVAFWTNLTLSIFLWACIILLRDPVASFVGNPGYGLAIAVACFSLPLTSFSSIQEALYTRNLNYKVLFYNRLIAIFTPIIITIPLALLGLGYWSLIIGTICGNLAKSINLTIRSDWKPNLYYSVSLLKEMLSFSIWTLFESLALWASTWVDIFIISNQLGSYYTGLYKNSQITVTGIISIVTAATTSVLFSSLSRVQNDDEKFKGIFAAFQRNVSIFVLPMGVGIFVFRNLITQILLGSKWAEASTFIGIWGLCTSLVAVYGTFCREAYRAKGRPKLSLSAQLLHLAFIVPVCYFGVQKGFNFLIYARSFAYLQIIVVHLIFLKLFIKISPLQILKTTWAPAAASVLMGALALVLKHYSNSFILDFLAVILCAVFYFCCLSLVPSYRATLMKYVGKVLPGKKATK